MIQITLYRNSRKEYCGFKSLGHAGFAEEGQDIVCAAVSILVINTINSIETYAKDSCSVISDDRKGLIDYQLKDRPSKEAELLLKAMVLGLRQIADDENYARYIDLTFEEV